MNTKNGLRILAILIILLSLFNLGGILLYRSNMGLSGAATASASITISSSEDSSSSSSSSSSGGGDDSSSSSGTDTGGATFDDEETEESSEIFNEGVTTETSETSETIWELLDYRAIVEIYLHAEEIDIYKISFYVTENVENPSLTIDFQESFFSGVRDIVLEDGSLAQVYQRFQITPHSLPSDILEDVEMSFSVTKSWLEENGLDNKHIAMYRYVDGNWVQLTTFISGETIGGYNYLAQSPGFSYFAIAETDSQIEEIDLGDACITTVFTCYSFETSCFIGDLQTRNCYDDNGCSLGAIEETRICSVENGGVHYSEDCQSSFTCGNWEPQNCDVGELRERACFDQSGCIDDVLIEADLCGAGDESDFVEETLLSDLFGVANLAGEAWTFSSEKSPALPWVIISLLVFVIIGPISLWWINRSGQEYELSDLHANIDGNELHIRVVVRAQHFAKSAEIVEKWDSDLDNEFVLEGRKGEV